MALLEEQFTEKLETGAPNITYEGNEGQEQQIAQALWDKLPPQVRMQFGSFNQFFSSGAWKKVLQMLQQQQQQMQGRPEEIQETETIQQQGPQEGIASMMPAQMANGGDVRLASASDPMDDKNQIANMLFGKPLHDLTPDELIDLDEWLEDKAQKWGGAHGGRARYGLGSFVKSITKPIKKVLSSDIGKAALLYAGTAGLGNLAGGLGGAQPWMGGKWLLPSNMATNFLGAKPFLSSTAAMKGAAASGGTSGLLGVGGPLGRFALTKGTGSLMPTALGWGAAATAAPLLAAGAGNWDKGPESFSDRLGGQFDFDYNQMREDIAEAVDEGDYEKFLGVLAKYNLTEGVQIGEWDTLAHGAQGGRAMAQGGRMGYFAGGPLVKKGIDALRKFKRPIYSFDDESKMIVDLMDTKKYTQEELMALDGDQLVEIYVREGFTSPKAIPNVEETIELKDITPKKRIDRQEGGLMDLGGMEKDYRNDGGFVPLGGEEKADDVPARLSRNEFVFTADAVRNAGGGDIDAGAEVMENVMKNLEGGGKISEESQGLGGAGDMFATSERLSEVV